MSDHFKVCHHCQTKHAKGLINCPKFSSRSPEALAVAKEAVKPTKAPAKKIVSIPPMPSPETLAEIAEIAGVPLNFDDVVIPETKSVTTPPSWWRATETPIDPDTEKRTAEYHARRAAMTIQDKLRELSNTGEYHGELFDEAADRIDALEAEIAAMKPKPKFDKKAYQRDYMKKRREAK